MAPAVFFEKGAASHCALHVPQNAVWVGDDKNAIPPAILKFCLSVS